MVSWMIEDVGEHIDSRQFGSLKGSNWVPVRAGVPQGTKLGPILFVIMINDLKLASPRCSYWKYVDDITISEFAAARGVSILQSELDNIGTWAATNNMVVNPKKCKEMTF